MKIECVLECANHLGEGPVWDVEAGYFFDFASTRLDLIAHVDAGQPRTRLNDGKCDRRGRFTHPAVHDLFAKEARPQFLAGSLFKVTGLGVRGLPEPRFAA
jgi:sugar lactone lactonase YvrE